MKKYDYILVGSGLYAGVFAWYARKNKKRCLVVEKRNHISETCTVRTLRASMCTSTAPISFIRATGRCGNL